MTVTDILVGSSLVVSLVALAVSVLAVRRDRAFLIVRMEDGAAGHSYMTVSNVGLRAARLTRVVMQRHRWRRWERPFDVTHTMALADSDPPDIAVFPLVVEPADEITVHLPSALFEKLRGGIGVEDASGRLHWPSFRTRRYPPADLDSLWK